MLRLVNNSLHKRLDYHTSRFVDSSSKHEAYVPKSVAKWAKTSANAYEDELFPLICFFYQPSNWRGAKSVYMRATPRDFPLCIKTLAVAALSS